MNPDNSLVRVWPSPDAPHQASALRCPLDDFSNSRRQRSLGSAQLIRGSVGVVLSNVADRIMVIIRSSCGNLTIVVDPSTRGPNDPSVS